MLTSAPPASDRDARRTWWFVYGLWAALTLQALVFVIRYPHAGPIVDEWEFIPALTGEEPFWPWLWKLHNEHRFPLPRLIYYPLFQLTHDFRTGCYVSLVGITLFTLLMISTAKRLRGRLHFADAFFPLSLLHVGHWENLRMGYQIVFMMNLVFAGILLRIILLTNRDNLLRRGVQAGLMTLLLLGCGAGGLAFGPFMAVWLLAVAAWFLLATPQPAQRSRAIWIVELTLLIPIYIGLYLQDYARPNHHADPIAIWISKDGAAWQALRSGLQSLSMVFGQVDSHVWPIPAISICIVLYEAVRLLVGVLVKGRFGERPRALGLLLYLGAMILMAVGIGWGRCVFRTEEGAAGYMGLSSRYSWIVWPALGAIYFQWLLYGGKRLARWAPIILFGIMAVMLPFNIATGLIEGEKYRDYNAAWEKSVRAGVGDDELIGRYYSNYHGDLKIRIQVGLHLLRKHHIQYFRPLPERPTNRGFAR